MITGLHVYRCHDYSNEIAIRHLLMQTSGLYDVFFQLWEKMMVDPSFTISTRDAVAWGKEHMKPVVEPGKKHHYTDTNYYVLGFIVERVTGKPFYQAMHEMIFDPLGMTHAWMHGLTSPKKQPEHPAAGLYMKDIDFMSVNGVPAINYAGDSVVALLSEYATFLKALTSHRIIGGKTLERMITDDVPIGFPRWASTTATRSGSSDPSRFSFRPRCTAGDASE